MSQPRGHIKRAHPTGLTGCGMFCEPQQHAGAMDRHQDFVGVRSSPQPTYRATGLRHSLRRPGEPLQMPFSDLFQQTLGRHLDHVQHPVKSGRPTVIGIGDFIDVQLGGITEK